MNRIKYQFSKSKLQRMVCLAIGMTLFVCQQSAGQSVAPKRSPKAIKLESQIRELELAINLNKTQLLGVKSEKEKYEKELAELKKRETSLNVSEASYAEVLKTLHSQRIQLSIDLAGIEARHDAIASAIKAAVGKQNDDVVKPFKRLVELHKSKYDRMMEKGSSATASEKQSAEISLLESQLQLANAMKPSGSLSHLNSQLLDTSLERAEKIARLEKANSLFEEVDEFHRYQTALASAKQNSRKSNRAEDGLLQAQERYVQRLKELQTELINSTK